MIQKRFFLRRRSGALQEVTTWSLLREDRVQIGNVQPWYLRILLLERSLNRSLQVGRATKFAEFMVCEFGAGETVLEDLSSKATPNSHGEFSAVDMTLENAETPGIQRERSSIGRLAVEVR